MSEFAVIAQNDESTWDDVKGDLYHYPATYQAILTPGCRVIYYKGKMLDCKYASERLSPYPHYFGVGVIGDSILDPGSRKKDRYCEILNYQGFEEAVLAKSGGKYLEEIPGSRASNYWRFGVREVSREVYERICGMARLVSYTPTLPHPNGDLESYHIEGTKKSRYTTYYERNPFYRRRPSPSTVSCVWPARWISRPSTDPGAPASSTCITTSPFPSQGQQGSIQRQT